MAEINIARKELSCKIVYYGPASAGKTTNIEAIYRKTSKEHRGDFTSITTDNNQTLFFDFMSFELGDVVGMNVKFKLYTVPGQVHYNANRKLVLDGADGIVFVADSQENRMKENLASFKNLEENLNEYQHNLYTLPIVFQYNKRDLSNIASIELMNQTLNSLHFPYFETTAFRGIGVLETMKAITISAVDRLNKQTKKLR